MTKHIFRTKSISEFISETKQDGGMNRVLGAGRCWIVRIRPAGGVVIAS